MATTMPFSDQLIFADWRTILRKPALFEFFGCNNEPTLDGTMRARL
jgi:hypothetical protein